MPDDNISTKILACLFTRLDPGEGNREMVEMEVVDVQVPEQGNATKQRLEQNWEQDQAAVNFLSILLHF